MSRHFIQASPSSTLCIKRIISQSTGGSTGEDEEELSGTCLETKHNTHHNEFLDHELIEVSLSMPVSIFTSRIQNVPVTVYCSPTLEKI